MAVLDFSNGDLTTDADGDATKTKTLNGEILSIKIDYSASADSGTDITISNDLGETIYTKSNSNTDAVVAPRKSVQNNAGTDVEYASSYPIKDKYTASSVTVTIAQGGASVANCAVVTVHFKPLNS